MRTIKIAVQNVRGLDQTKVHEIVKSLQREKVDVGILVEYKIGLDQNNKGKHWEKNLFGKMRIAISRNNENRNNGVLMIYSNSLAKSVRYKSLIDGYLSMMEIHLRSTKLYIMGLYNPCKKSDQDEKIKDKIKEIIGNTANEKCPLFVLGDFNAAMSPEGRTDKVMRRYDKNMVEFIDSCDMTVLSDNTMTYFCGSGRSSIDHVIGKNFNQVAEIRSVRICELTSQSDHLGRLLELNIRSEMERQSTVQHNNQSVKTILEQPWNFKYLSDLQGKFIKLNTHRKDRSKMEDHQLWQDKDLNELLRQLEDLVKRRKRTVNENQVDELIKQQELELRKKIKTTVNRLNNDGFKTFVEKIQKGNELLFKYGIPQKKMSASKNVRRLTDGDKQMVNINELLEFTSNHYGETFKVRKIDCKMKSIGRKLDCWKMKLLENITKKEIEDQLKRMNSKSATGYDGINLDDLKLLFKKRGKEMTELFSKEIKEGLSSNLKKGVLIPLHKKGDEDQIANYRPIVIGCMMSRLLMKVVTKRLMNFIIEKSVIPKRQLGFIKNRGATPGIQMLREFMIHGRLKNLKAIVTALDISNAYNNVNHELLIHMLKQQQFPEDFVDFVAKWLRDQQFVVKIMGHLSKEMKYAHGVPQGDPMSPLIFNLYVNGILSCMEGRETMILMFADDVIVFGRDKDDAERTIRNIVKELMELGMKLSPLKSEVMMSNWMDGEASLIKGHIVVDGVKIISKSTLKYLGVLFQLDGIWDKNINMVQEKLRERVRSLRYNWLRLAAIKQLLNSVLINGGM